MGIHILHIPKTGTKTTVELLPFGSLVFETCLRQIVFFSSDSFLNQPAYLKWAQGPMSFPIIYSSNQAYRFVLEVICGLHSMIKGETEIFGQFKEFYSNFRSEIDKNGMSDFFAQLIIDCKTIRAARIQHWSQNTYGSVTRKLLSPEDGVVLIGAGHLAREIAPWLKHVKSKSILLRRPRDLEPQFSGFCVEMAQNWQQSKQSNQLCQSNDITVLVVAAGISNNELRSYFTRWPNIRMVIDWRGDESWLGSASISVFRLHDLKQDSERAKKEELIKIDCVMQEIQTKALEFTKKAKHNPWGWEDFCA